MVKKHDEVMKAVADALEKEPSAELQALYDRAVEVDSSVKDLTLRQFNARYPLQVKRQRSGARRGPRKRTATTGRRPRRDAGARREELRKIFFDFAQEFAEAEHKAQVVSVLNQVERYSERVEKLFPRR